MRVIGITGSFGSGKSTVARFLKKKGCVVLDADKIARTLMQPGQAGYQAVVRSFGKDILSRGRIDRKKLATAVFKDPQARRRLNAIIHPQVIDQTRRRIAQYRRSKKIHAVILDVPLLVESNMHTMCDVVIVVKANRDLQFKRIKQRSGLSRLEVQQRINSQLSLSQKQRYADFVIDNRKDLRATQCQAEVIWKKISKGYKKKENGICQKQ